MAASACNSREQYEALLSFCLFGVDVTRGWYGSDPTFFLTFELKNVGFDVDVSRQHSFASPVDSAGSLITGEEISFSIYMNGFFIAISPAGSVKSLITGEESLVKMFLQDSCTISSSVIIQMSVSTGENQARACHQHASHKVSSSVTATFSSGTGETLADQQFVSAVAVVRFSGGSGSFQRFSGNTPDFHLYR